MLELGDARVVVNELGNNVVFECLIITPHREEILHDERKTCLHIRFQFFSHGRKFFLCRKFFISRRKTSRGYAGKLLNFLMDRFERHFFHSPIIAGPTPWSILTKIISSGISLPEDDMQSIKVSVYTPQGERCVGPVEVSKCNHDRNARVFTYTVDEKESLDHGVRMSWGLGEGWTVQIESRD